MWGPDPTSLASASPAGRRRRAIITASTPDSSSRIHPSLAAASNIAGPNLGPAARCLARARHRPSRRVPTAARSRAPTGPRTAAAYPEAASPLIIVVSLSNPATMMSATLQPPSAVHAARTAAIQPQSAVDPALSSRTP
ncbi:hypothetical protein BRADI_2g52803v3 [Brachypodium distachyon]|uniref:Uncharacterized protein n=1 Tax=Brachypodium distachyon TaxID=15368 RepID=A0A0Q3GGL1_BRADI|nr:hypothetical protein BRADI_2g52803v3 [Brachypodium distachyon]